MIVKGLIPQPSPPYQKEYIQGDKLMLPNTELTQANLNDLIDQSHQQRLLIGFWAPSLPESQDTIQMLHQLATPYAEHLIFSTLNCETEREVAAQFGVQSLPTIALFQNGRPIDGLYGPQTQDAIKAWLETHLPNATELAITDIQKHIAEKDYVSALDALRQLIQTQPESQTQVALYFAECLLETQKFDEGKQWLDKVRLQDQDAHYKQLLSKYQLHEQASQSPEIQNLETAYQANPNTPEIGYELAIQYSQVNRHEEALTLLFSILKQDMNFADGQAKAAFLDILSALGQGDPVAAPFRRQFYALLY